MKTTIAIMTLVLSLGAFAQEKVEISSEQMQVSATSVVLVRTSKSPGTVELKMNIAMENSVCERYETRRVLRTSGVSCGYDSHFRRIRVGQVCVLEIPVSHQCLRFEETFRQEVVQVPRTCMVPESYCAQYGTAVSYDTDTVKIRFSSLPALGGSESETFLVEAKQTSYGSSSVFYSIKPLETLRAYRVTQKKFLGFKRDSFVVEE
jgi:hypothetical protein